MIPNLVEVDSHVVRGGRPTDRSDWHLLATLYRVRDVLVLNGDPDLDAGLRVVAVTIRDDEAQGVLPPGILEKVDAELDALLAVSAGARVYVHCTEGVDRTGIAVARYRVRRCGWRKDDAHAEWVARGSHRYRGLEEAWAAWQP